MNRFIKFFMLSFIYDEQYPKSDIDISAEKQIYKFVVEILKQN